LTVLDRLAQRLARREQMALPHELIERARTHAVRKRPREVRECRLPAIARPIRRAHGTSRARMPGRALMSAQDGSRARPRMRSAITAHWLSPANSSANATAMPI